jgi:fatty acid synthase, animal type
MGLVKSGAASSRVNVARELLWPVPKHWTMEEAATVPMPYAHAFYCLVSMLYFHYQYEVTIFD